MKIKNLISLVSIYFLAISPMIAQETPDKIYGRLFTDVQNSSIFSDSKVFVDATPKRKPALILKDYLLLCDKKAGFSLEKFVQDNFELPKSMEITPKYTSKIIDKNIVNKNIVNHINILWDSLKREADTKSKKNSGSSLLSLPKSYIVPGGRFREIYYWDSYFTMLGLKESKKVDLIENMVENFAYLINTYGHIPNGNRTYYLSRSQPPYFSMMVALLASIKGDAVYTKYLPELEKEYAYWMEGATSLENGKAYKRVVKLQDGTILNRYWDDLEIPRQEGYKEDVKIAQEAATAKMATMRFASAEAANLFREANNKNTYRNLRAGACSGWDFSSRWFADPQNIATIEIIEIIPVDLNCLLLHLEQTILKAKGKIASQTIDKRIAAISKYFWNEQLKYFTDYNFVTQNQQNTITAAGIYPLYFINFNDSNFEKGKAVAEVIRKNLLKEGGLQTTTNNTNQQWDAPNGWAPLQWMAILALENCNEKELAKEIALRWYTLNTKVYERTGKLLEKYNVVDMSLEAGGGEYPSQDGFGWTNGVLLAIMNKYGWLEK